MKFSNTGIEGNDDTMVSLYQRIVDKAQVVIVIILLLLLFFAQVVIAQDIAYMEYMSRKLIEEYFMFKR